MPTIKNSPISIQGGAPLSLSSNGLTPLGSQTPKAPVNTGVPIPFNENANVVGNAIQSTGIPKPVSTISSKKAVDTINNVIKPTIKTYDEQVATSKLNQQNSSELDATTTPDMKVLLGSGKPNPNYVNPNTTTTTNTKTQANPLEEAQTNEILHPGQSQLYNIRTGEQEWVNSTNGEVPLGYSNLNPKTRGDVTNSIQDSNGNTIDELSDGTYRRIDINGNYTIGTQQMFNDAKRVQEFSNDLDNIRQGIYNPSQQKQ